jgi:uncharacterized protein with PIN domain
MSFQGKTCFGTSIAKAKANLNSGSCRAYTNADKSSQGLFYQLSTKGVTQNGMGRFLVDFAKFA